MARNSVGNIKIVGSRKLHAKLAERAKEENVSLNTFVVYALGAKVGIPLRTKRKCIAPPPEPTSTEGFDQLFEQ